jgi:hypothetical protein
MTEEPNHHTYEEFYDTLKGFVKSEQWLKMTCYLHLDKHGELVIFDPQIEKEKPTEQ